MFSILLLNFFFVWFISVLVGLYEEPEKPNNALEYPFHGIWAFAVCPNGYLFLKKKKRKVSWLFKVDIVCYIYIYIYFIFICYKY